MWVDERRDADDDVQDDRGYPFQSNVWTAEGGQREAGDWREPSQTAGRDLHQSRKEHQ